MFENYQNDPEYKKSIIALLHRMATSDRQISNIEKTYLHDIARGIGLDDFMVQEVIENAQNYKLEPPPDEQGRMTVLYYLLFMMRVDGKVESREEKLIHEAGFRLGFNEHLTGDLIRVMKTYLTGNIPPEAMIGQIKKYMN